MLEWLRVQNVALIRDTTLEFGEGLNVVTGETGAGKSVLLESLLLALGTRTKPHLVGAAADRSLVEAGFRIADEGEPVGPVPDFLEEHGVEVEEGEIVIRREIRLRGGSGTVQGRIRVNGTPMPAGTLRKLGAMLGEVYSQGEHLTIQSPEAAREILDRVSGLDDLRLEVRDEYERLRQREEELREIEDAVARETSESDALRRMAEEITAAALEPDEDGMLRKERRTLASAGQMRSLLRDARNALYESETSASSQIAVAIRSLEHALELDPDFDSALSRCRETLAAVEDLALDLREREAQVAAAPERLAWIEERLALIRGLERRYVEGAGGVSAILARFENISLFINDLDRKKTIRKKLSEETAAAVRRYQELAQKLSRARTEAASRVGELVQGELADLGMGKARFEVSVTRALPVPEQATAHFQAHGLDRVEFRFDATGKLAPQPIQQVASGGESSRFFVALRAAVAGEGGPPTVVFDEADAGTSGRIAHAVGARLLRLAAGRQVISVTHLPQVAALGSNHLVVETLQSEGSVRVRRLTGAARIEEIARMLAGPEITESARDHARELLASQEQASQAVDPP